MARCDTIERAEEIQKLYWKHGKEFAPQLIHSEQPDSDARVKLLMDGSSRIAVCVNMLGEGNGRHRYRHRLQHMKGMTE